MTQETEGVGYDLCIIIIGKFHTFVEKRQVDTL